MQTVQSILDELEGKKKKRKEFTLKVTTSENKQIYKDRIITALYNSGVVHDKVKGICYRNFINTDTYIHEDILQETFYWLSKKPPDELIEMYEDNPKRLIGLSVRIAVLKGVASNSRDKDYPKHSLAKYILHASNLQQRENLSPTDDYNEEDGFSQFIFDPDSLPNNFQEMWDTIKSELSAEERQFLDEYLNTEKRQGRHGKEIREQYKLLFNSIANACEKHGYNII